MSLELSRNIGTRRAFGPLICAGLAPTRTQADVVHSHASQTSACTLSPGGLVRTHIWILRASVDAKAISNKLPKCCWCCSHTQSRSKGCCSLPLGSVCLLATASPQQVAAGAFGCCGSCRQSPLSPGAFFGVSEGTDKISLAGGKMGCGQGDFRFL